LEEVPLYPRFLISLIDEAGSLIAPPSTPEVFSFFPLVV